MHFLPIDIGMDPSDWRFAPNLILDASSPLSRASAAAKAWNKLTHFKNIFQRSQLYNMSLAGKNHKKLGLNTLKQTFRMDASKKWSPRQWRPSPSTWSTSPWWRPSPKLRRSQKGELCPLICCTKKVAKSSNYARNQKNIHRFKFKIRELCRRELQVSV
jgi:hypothetical protein